MIIRRIVKDVDGNIEATLVLSPEQAGFLINMGLVTLTTAGTVTLQDMTEEEFAAHREKAKAQGDESNSEVTFAVDPSKLN